MSGQGLPRPPREANYASRSRNETFAGRMNRKGAAGQPQQGYVHQDHVPLGVDISTASGYVQREQVPRRQVPHSDVPPGVDLGTASGHYRRQDNTPRVVDIGTASGYLYHPGSRGPAMSSKQPPPVPPKDAKHVALSNDPAMSESRPGTADSQASVQRRNAVRRPKTESPATQGKPAEVDFFDDYDRVIDKARKEAELRINERLANRPLTPPPGATPEELDSYRKRQREYHPCPPKPPNAVVDTTWESPLDKLIRDPMSAFTPRKAHGVDRLKGKPSNESWYQGDESKFSASQLNESWHPGDEAQFSAPQLKTVPSSTPQLTTLNNTGTPPSSAPSRAVLDHVRPAVGRMTVQAGQAPPRPSTSRSYMQRPAGERAPRNVEEELRNRAQGHSEPVKVHRMPREQHPGRGGHSSRDRK